MGLNENKKSSVTPKKEEGGKQYENLITARRENRANNAERVTGCLVLCVVV